MLIAARIKHIEVDGNEGSDRGRVDPAPFLESLVGWEVRAMQRKSGSEGHQACVSTPLIVVEVRGTED
jgi:hypothetical protein